MNSVQFSGVIEIIGVNPYVHVSKTIATSVKPGWRRPIPVVVHINHGGEKLWHTNLMPMGNGDFYLYLHGDMRNASKTAVGDRVDISIRFDEGYKGGPATLPDWLQTTIERDKTARENWGNLSPSRQKEVVRYITSLKSDEARQRNVHTLMKMLGGDEGRFMGRDWKDGS